MIRAATLSDIYAIEGMAVPYMRDWYIKLKIDPKKIRKLLTMAISSAKHFCYVSENDRGEVVGALVAVSSENLWAQRQNCTVQLWHSEVVGDGRKMMKAFLDWIKNRRIIRVAGYVPDNNDMDFRVEHLLERLGFDRYGGAYLVFN